MDSKAMAAQDKESDSLKALIQTNVRRIRYNPSSTYRLQLHPQHMTFSRAAGQVSYLKALGIDTLYLSPCFEAVAGSEHGYDIVDPRRFREELGGEEGFLKLSDELKRYKIGLVLDFVPNHMGVMGGHNRLWNDVLEFGPLSRYADFFDIDWSGLRPQNSGRVLIPILGEAFGRILEKGEIKIVFEQGCFQIRYWEHFYPASPQSYLLILKHRMQDFKSVCRDSRSFESYLKVVRAFEKLVSLPVPEELSSAAKQAAAELAELCSREQQAADFLSENIRIFNGIPGEKRSFDLLESFLAAQHFRLSYWRVAAEEINYRRFFDVNGLAATRMENPAVFNFFHELIFKLVEEGRVQGLRIDHPDGLYHPAGYFFRLQCEVLMRAVESGENLNLSGADRENLSKAVNDFISQIKTAEKLPFFLIAEKVLDRKEPLPEDWKVSGSVGYDFLNSLNHLYINRPNQDAMNGVYSEISGIKSFDFEKMTYDGKKLFALIHMAGEMHALSMRLKRIANRSRYFRDYTLNHLTVAVREVISCFPVYRSYTAPESSAVSDRDRNYIHIAIQKAKRKTPTIIPDVYDYLEKVLTLSFGDEISVSEKSEYLDFVMRFQQLTAPILAKGIEDTVFYKFHRLISANEVGGDPRSFGVSRREFHTQNVLRQKKWPRNLLATSTHDTKRSEDVRMRLNVLSEIPEAWHEQVKYWRAANESKKVLVDSLREPDYNTEYFIYQTLIGVMPAGGPQPEKEAQFFDRILKYLEKALREAKEKTNWITPNPEYEEAVKEFVLRILKPSTDNAFLKSFLPFHQEISRLGGLNSLSSLNLKAASPGVFDVYQGTELWNLKLVDPDNRAWVNFELREKILRSGAAEESTEHRGFEKFDLLKKALRFRKKHKSLMIRGSYIPVEVEGEKSRHITAFLRRSGRYWALAVSARFFSDLNLKEPGKLGATPRWFGRLKKSKKPFRSKIFTPDILSNGILPEQPALLWLKFWAISRARFLRSESSMKTSSANLLTLGANIKEGGVQFRVWAPLVKHMAIELPKDGKQAAMKRDTAGFFEAFIPGVQAGEDYCLILDGEKKRPDPVSRCLPDGVHGVSRIVDPEKFQWSDASWEGRDLEDAFFYELHIGTFTAGGTFSSAAEKIPYLKELGVTHIELMPVAAFPGKRNWGYDGVGLFAVQNSYGTPDDFKAFVNACHAAGLAVCLDVVFNHLGPEGNYLWDFGKYFTDKRNTPWGQAVNFDDESSEPVRDFMLQNALYWIREYHVDALRLDAVHEIYDDGPRHVLEEMNERVKSLADSENRKVHLIAEAGYYNFRLTQQKQRGGFGLDSQWCDDFHHTLHVFLTGEKQGYYEDFQGFEDVARAVENGSVLAGRRSKFWGTSCHAIEKNLSGKDFVVCLQNHDQIGNRAFGERFSTLTGFEEQKTAAALLMLSPYLPLIFMGEEYGEENPFGYFVDHSDPWLKDAVREGRRREFSSFGWHDMLDPTDEKTFKASKLGWNIPEGSRRQQTQAWYRALAELRKRFLKEGFLEKRKLKLKFFEEEKAIYLKYELTPGQSAFLFCKFQSDKQLPQFPEPAGVKIECLLHSEEKRFGGSGENGVKNFPQNRSTAVAGLIYGARA